MLPTFERQVPQAVSFDLKFEGSFQNSLRYVFWSFPFVPPSQEASITELLFSANPPWWEGHLLCTSSFSLSFSSLLHLIRITNHAPKELHTLGIYSATCVPQSPFSCKGLCLHLSPSTSLLPLFRKIRYLLGDSTITPIRKMGWEEMRERYCYFRKY